ncbi:hypothetical protein [Motilibacter aurantiacus]|uniref:hypothetical protein n=1 Tax=Motilibacter aurantiacus TaxID=2714955 RepID=UPI001409C78C|nr:hypothetical protein [Motilibacter aurantiacus]NHC46182.1 hypothetical protein [Motilibacter aurantiacus]
MRGLTQRMQDSGAPEAARGNSDGTEQRPSVGAELVRVVVAAQQDEQQDRGERARQVGRLAAALATSARAAGARAVLGGRWLVDQLLEAAPRIPVRDRETLRAHHPGLADDRIAEILIRTAARSTAAIGATGGAVMAGSWALPPSVLLSAPVEVATEALAVAAVEVKLVAELHSLYLVSPPGAGAQRAAGFVMAWAAGRGIDPRDPRWMSSAVSSAAKAQIRRRMAGRAARGATTLGPLLTGAVAGATVNSRATRSLGSRVHADLRRQAGR